MADLLAQAGRYNELVNTYQEILEYLQDTWEKVVTHYRLAQVLEERLDRERKLSFITGRVLSLDPTYMPALQSFGKLCQRRGSGLK